MSMEVRHMCLSVRGFLNNSKFPKDFEGMFKGMSAYEARDYLYDCLTEGKEVLPMSPECTNFDYSGGGCLGCPAEEEP